MSNKNYNVDKRVMKNGLKGGIQRMQNVLPLLGYIKTALRKELGVNSKFEKTTLNTVSASVTIPNTDSIYVVSSYTVGSTITLPNDSAFLYVGKSVRVENMTSSTVVVGAGGTIRINSVGAGTLTYGIPPYSARTFTYGSNGRYTVSDQVNASGVTTTRVNLASSNILALNATPITIVPAPGSGYAIEVISASLQLVYFSTNYTVSGVTSIDLLASGTSTSQFTGGASMLSASSSQIVKFTSVTGGIVKDNTALVIKAQGANPAAGNSSAYVHVTYRVLALT